MTFLKWKRERENWLLFHINDRVKSYIITNYHMELVAINHFVCNNLNAGNWGSISCHATTLHANTFVLFSLSLSLSFTAFLLFFLKKNQLTTRRCSNYTDACVSVPFLFSSTRNRADVKYMSTQCVCHTHRQLTWSPRNCVKHKQNIDMMKPNHNHKQTKNMIYKCYRPLSFC